MPGPSAQGPHSSLAFGSPAQRSPSAGARPPVLLGPPLSAPGPLVAVLPPVTTPRSCSPARFRNGFSPRGEAPAAPIASPPVRVVAPPNPSLGTSSGVQLLSPSPQRGVGSPPALPPLGFVPGLLVGTPPAQSA